jgi:hypothetical protein
VRADQIRRLKQRDSLKMRQINQLVVTAAGYSELLDVILADNDSLAQVSEILSGNNLGQRCSDLLMKH